MLIFGALYKTLCAFFPQIADCLDWQSFNFRQNLEKHNELGYYIDYDYYCNCSKYIKTQYEMRE